MYAIKSSKGIMRAFPRAFASRYVNQAINMSTKTSSTEWAMTDIPPPSPGKGFFSERANFDVTKSQHKFERWKWVLDLLGYYNEDAMLRQRSGQVFHSCVNQAAQPEFYQALQLVPDFRGQQALLMMHIWIVHRRLIAENDQTAGKLMQESLFDRLWEETTVRIRHQNVSELTVNKHLNEVQQICFNSCVAYDKGFALGEKQLQEAISRHLLNVDGPSKMKQAGLMSEYVKRELKNVQKLDSKLLLEGTIPWGKPLPVSAEAASQNISMEKEYELIGQKHGNWRSALDIRGTRYYWNMTTRMSSWDMPEDAKA